MPLRTTVFETVASAIPPLRHSVGYDTSHSAARSISLCTDRNSGQDRAQTSHTIETAFQRMHRYTGRRSRPAGVTARPVRRKPEQTRGASPPDPCEHIDLRQDRDDLLWLLVAVSAVAFFTHFVHVPYTVALVVTGLALGVIGGPFSVPLTEDLILDVFVPALLFEAAYNLPWQRLRAEIRPITALAIPGVIASTFIVGATVHFAGLRWPVALLFGALISATDPVSVLATFRNSAPTAASRSSSRGKASSTTARRSSSSGSSSTIVRGGQRLGGRDGPRLHRLDRRRRSRRPRRRLPRRARPRPD